MSSRTISNADDWATFLAWVANMPHPFTVSVTKGRKRSTDQNALQRAWIAQISAELDNGQTPENIRGECKLHIGVAIMKNGCDEYADAYDRIIRPLPYEAKLELMQVPIDFPVTRDMTVKQKADYLDGMQRYWAEKGVVLLDPKER